MPSHKMITGITPNSQAVNAATPHGSQTIIRKKELGLEKSTGAPPPREESEKLHVCVCACVCELSVQWERGRRNNPWPVALTTRERAGLLPRSAVCKDDLPALSCMQSRPKTWSNKLLSFLNMEKKKKIKILGFLLLMNFISVMSQHNSNSSN